MPIPETIVQLRLSGGRMIQTFASVLKYPESLFAELLDEENIGNKQLVRLECSHRDKRMLNFIVDCLRKMRQHTDDSGFEFAAPEDFTSDEWRALIAETRYWRLSQLETQFRRAANDYTNTITIAYHGALSSGKPGGANSDVNFRRINRIVVHGQACVCRQVFGHQLNETRDGNVDASRYTSRFYLTHNFLEQAFDVLANHRFKLISSTSHTPMAAPQTLAPNRSISLQKGKNTATNQAATHERQFLHYSQFTFVRTS